MSKLFQEEADCARLSSKTCMVLIALVASILSGCSTIFLGSFPTDVTPTQGLQIAFVVALAIPVTLVAVTALLAPPPNRSVWIAGVLLSFVATVVVGFLVGMSKLNGGSTMPLVYGVILTALALFVIVLLSARIRWSSVQSRLPLQERWSPDGGSWNRAALWSVAAIAVVAAAGIGSYYQPRMKQVYEAHKQWREHKQTLARIEARKAAEAGGSQTIPAQKPERRVESILGNMEFMPLGAEDIAASHNNSDLKLGLQKLVRDTCRIEVVSGSTDVQAPEGDGAVLFTLYPGKEGAGGLLKLRRGKEPFRMTWGELITQEFERSQVLGRTDDSAPYVAQIGLPGWGVLGLRINESVKCSADRKSCTTNAQFYSAIDGSSQSKVVLREICTADVGSNRLFPAGLYTN